jgi:hypothetical protein
MVKFSIAFYEATLITFGSRELCELVQVEKVKEIIGGTIKNPSNQKTNIKITEPTAKTVKLNNCFWSTS